MRILVNTISTKKISGGAFQIAQNFLLKSLEYKEIEWYYITSQDLDEVIGKQFEDIRTKKYFVFPTQPDFRHTYEKVKKQVRKLEEKIRPDVVYTVTAPSYFSFKTTEVMRFTNPWVAHPNEYSWSVLPFKEKIRTYLYCLNQKRLIRSAHYFITQAETTKQGIMRITHEDSSHIAVVNNVLPAAFKKMDNTPIADDKWINIAAVGAPVPHKNFDIIPNVLLELKRKNVKNVRFHTTIPFGHPLAHSIKMILEKHSMLDNWVNHGRVSQIELGEIYRRCQFAFLPTLLEVFSASTIEAMYFNLPVVATKFNFNTEILEDSCLYYEPKNVQDATRQLVRLINDKDLQDECKKKMQVELAKYGDYDAHFNAIKAFLIDVINGKVS